jgi:nucleotide-binding universal stress UspA family protein
MQAEAEVSTRGSMVEAPVEPGSRLSRLPFKKAKWDKQPSQSSAVLIATVGISIPVAVIKRAVELSGGRPVAVVSIARIYGSSMGLPNPGLMPTRKEMDEQRALVTKAIDRLERAGVEAWGQVASTRRYAKTIAQAAQARGVDHVLVVSPEVPRWRLLVEGDTARDVRRRIGKEMSVEGITV